MVLKKEEVGEIPKKHGVIMAIVVDGKILLEERDESGATYFGFTIIPGGA